MWIELYVHLLISIKGNFQYIFQNVSYNAVNPIKRECVRKLIYFNIFCKKKEF